MLAATALGCALETTPKDKNGCGLSCVPLRPLLVERAQHTTPLILKSCIACAKDKSPATAPLLKVLTCARITDFVMRPRSTLQPHSVCGGHTQQPLLLLPPGTLGGASLALNAESAGAPQRT